jgi:hypothetical protein
MIVGGTRPEAIKLAPVMWGLEEAGVEYVFVWSARANTVAAAPPPRKYSLSTSKLVSYSMAREKINTSPGKVKMHATVSL